MNEMYHRQYHATSMERFLMNLRYVYHKRIKPAIKCAAEIIIGIIWLLSIAFLLPIFAAFFN